MGGSRFITSFNNLKILPIRLLDTSTAYRCAKTFFIRLVIGEDEKPHILYSPDPDINHLPDSFRYTITDAFSQTSEATVHLDVQCGSSQTSDGGDMMGILSMVIIILFTLMSGVYFVRKENERGEV